MSVEELIELLKTLPQHKTVAIWSPDDGKYMPVTGATTEWNVYLETDDMNF